MGPGRSRLHPDLGNAPLCQGLPGPARILMLNCLSLSSRTTPFPYIQQARSSSQHRTMSLRITDGKYWWQWCHSATKLALCCQLLGPGVSSPVKHEAATLHWREKEERRWQSLRNGVTRSITALIHNKQDLVGMCYIYIPWLVSCTAATC